MSCTARTLFTMFWYDIILLTPFLFNDYTARRLFFANFNEKIVFVDLPKFGHQQEIESPDFNSYPKIFLLVS